MVPNITIENMFKRVRNTVYIWSNSTQVTWEHTSLMGDFHASIISIFIKTLLLSIAAITLSKLNDVYAALRSSAKLVSVAAK